MSRGQRTALLAAVTVAIAVVAFVVLKPDDEKQSTSSTKPAAGKTATEAEPGGKTEPEANPQPAPKPKTEQIEVKGGSPVGGVAALTSTKGETVRFAVSSDTADEVHVHGYDLEKEVGPGKPARFSFPAKLEGRFEIELHSSHQPVAELEVKP